MTIAIDFFITPSGGKMQGKENSKKPPSVKNVLKKIR